MGKSWKGRSHVKSSYPYRTSRVGQHVHIVRPRARKQGNGQPYFIGMFAGRRQEHLMTGPKLRKVPDLKRLSFVRAYSIYLSARVAAAYSSSRASLPGSWQQRVQQLETRVSTVGSPLWTNVHTTSDRILWQLDCKLDGLCEVADGWVGSSAPPALMQHAAHAKAPEDMEALRQRVVDAFAALAASPPVHRVLEGVEPSREYLAARYQEAHHAVVASQTYNSLLRTLAGLAERMQHSQLSAIAQRLYALVSPVAEPTLDRITASPLYKDLVEHLKPVDGPKGAAGSSEAAAHSAALALPSCAAS